MSLDMWTALWSPLSPLTFLSHGAKAQVTGCVTSTCWLYPEIIFLKFKSGLVDMSPVTPVLERHRQGMLMTPA